MDMSITVDYDPENKSSAPSKHPLLPEPYFLILLIQCIFYNYFPLSQYELILRRFGRENNTRIFLECLLSKKKQAY